MTTSSETATPFPPGIDAEVWEDFADYLRDWRAESCEHSDLACCAPCLRDRIKAHLTRREPTPTMPVLPTMPGAVIRATVKGYISEVPLSLDSRGWHNALSGVAFEASRITAWEPLVTRSEVLAQLGVEELREAVTAWTASEITDLELADAVRDHLVRLDESTSRTTKENA